MNIDSLLTFTARTPLLPNLTSGVAPTGEQPMIDMSPSIVLILAIGAFVTAGVYLLLERSLTRVLLGVILIGNGINLMFMVAGGRAGGAPIVGLTADEDMSDPLPQAMVLTAIVITLGLTAFVLAMAYRSWQLLGHDEVQDDMEDRRIARIAARNAPTVRGSDESDLLEIELNPEDVAAEVRDETSDSSELDNIAMAEQNAAHYRQQALDAKDPEAAKKFQKKAEWWAAQQRKNEAQQRRNDVRREDSGNELTDPAEETAAQAAYRENATDKPQGDKND